MKHLSTLLSLVLISLVFVVLFTVGIEKQVDADQVDSRNLQKIFATAAVLSVVHQHAAEWEPSDREIRYMLVHLTNYRSCQDFDYFDDTEKCMSAISLQEVRLVRLAAMNPDAFEITVKEGQNERQAATSH